MALKPKFYEEVLTGQNATASATIQADASRMEDFVGELILTAVAGGPGTIDVSFEDSVDGLTWGPWFAFAQQSTAAPTIVRAAPTRPPLGFVRRRQVIAGGGTWAYTVRLVGEPKQ